MSKVHKCPRLLLFAHMETTSFQMVILTCYTFGLLALLQGRPWGKSNKNLKVLVLG